MAEVEAKPTTPPGPSPDATPAWFIAGPDLSSVGERRERNARDQVIAQLQTIFPETSTEDLAAAVVIGGDLQVIVDRILAMQAQDDAEAAVAATESSAGSSSSATPGPTRRVRFAAKMATSEPRQPMEQMTLAGTDAPPPPGILVTNGKAKASSAAAAAGGTGSRAGSSVDQFTDEQLADQMAASGITVEPTPGSARGARRDGSSVLGATLGGVLQNGTLDKLKTQSVEHLAAGALKLNARIIKTSNVLEEGLLTDKIVTLFVIEVRQLAFCWEVKRRYSEFYRFHELLVLQWTDLPPLPPKLLFSQECDDLAERMMALDSYLRALLASPALALSPLVCTFLDAIDVNSFRGQMLPRCVLRRASARMCRRALHLLTDRVCPRTQAAANGGGPWRSRRGNGAAGGGAPLRATAQATRPILRARAAGVWSSHDGSTGGGGRLSTT